MVVRHGVIGKIKSTGVCRRNHIGKRKDQAREMRAEGKTGNSRSLMKGESGEGRMAWGCLEKGSV